MPSQEKRGFVQAHPLPRQPEGFQVSYENGSSRKNLNLPRPARASEEAPLAIESFAMDPEYYAELMNRVEAELARNA